MPKFDFRNGMMMSKPERPIAPLVDWIVLKTGADRTKIDNIIRANRHNRLVMMALSADYLSRCMLLKQIGTQYELPGGFDKANTPCEIEDAAKKCKECLECYARCARPLIKSEPADGKNLAAPVDEAMDAAFGNPLVEVVQYRKGHKNSKGEDAPWVIVSCKTKKILSSHKSKEKADEHLQQMEYYKHAKTESLREALREGYLALLGD